MVRTETTRVVLFSYVLVQTVAASAWFSSGGKGGTGCRRGGFKTFFELWQEATKTMLAHRQFMQYFIWTA